MAATATAVMPMPHFDKGDDADDALNGNGRLGDLFPLQVKNTFIDFANVQDEEDPNADGITDAFSRRQMSEPPPSLGAYGITNPYLPWFALELAQQKVPQPAPVPEPARGTVPGMEGFTDALHGMGMAPGNIDGTIAPPSDWANTTTVMMRNIPNKYTQRMLLTEINHTGFLGTFDFLYLPIDPDTNANRGYAFMNFIDPGFAWMFKTSYEGRKMNRFNSNKVVSVMPATLQGFEANYSHYSSARVNRGDPAARPLFLRDPNFKQAAGFGGQAVDTRGIRGGRRRRGAGAGSSGNLERSALSQYMSQANSMFGGIVPHDFGPGPIGSVYFGVEPKEAAMEESMGGAAAMVPKFCPHCGAAIQPTFQFCPSCGEGLNFAST